MYERILVGTDGSSTAAKAVARAVEVAANTGASLTILTPASPERGGTVVAAEAAKHKGSGVAIDTKVSIRTRSRRSSTRPVTAATTCSSWATRA